jgi:hypothetical protein
MTEALQASQLREVVHVPAAGGPIHRVLDERVTLPAGGITAVVFGCQFEKTALNVIVTFDGEQKIGGLRFVPRTAASQKPSAPPTANRFKEEVTVGTGEWALPGTVSTPFDVVIRIPAVMSVYQSCAAEGA